MAMIATAVKRTQPVANPAPTVAAPPRAGATRTEAPPATTPAMAAAAPTDQYGTEQTPPDQSTQISVPPSATPVTINVTQKVEQKVEAPRERGYDSNALYTTYPYYYVGVPVVRPVVPVAPAPVYWGFGGVRRPGTWR